MKNYSIKVVTILSFSIAILLIIVYLLFSNFFALNVMRKKTTDNIVNSVQIIGKKADWNMNKIELCMVKKTVSDEVVSILLKDKRNVQYYIDINKIRDGLNDDVEFMPFTNTMFIYYDKIDCFIMSGDQSDKARLELIGLVQRYTSGERDIWCLVDYKGEKHLMIAYYNELGIYAGALISVKSILSEWENMNVIGFGKSQYFTMNNNRCIESAGDTKSNREIFENNLKDSSEEEKVKWYGKSLAVRYDMAIGDYQIYIVIDSDYGTTMYTGVWVLILMVPLLVFLAFVIYYFVVDVLLIKPLKNALTSMSGTLGQENIVLPEVESFSEVNRMMKMFNATINNLHDLKIGLYEKKIENEKAKMRILQSQINPHMFMNSMAIINSMAQFKTEESVDVICTLTKYLAEYFRFIIESDHDFIPIEDEIRNTENYLKIQKIRYPDLFTFSVEADNCGGVEIPPLTLQPIVENSIRHGFNGRDDFSVNVSCLKKENTLTVRISDNGIGFDDESLEMIRSGRDIDINQKRHFGIKNVYDLLKLAYNGEVAMNVYNNGGAVVEFVISDVSERTEN